MSTRINASIIDNQKGYTLQEAYAKIGGMGSSILKNSYIKKISAETPNPAFDTIESGALVLNNENGRFHQVREPYNNTVAISTSIDEDLLRDCDIKKDDYPSIDPTSL